MSGTMNVDIIFDIGTPSVSVRCVHGSSHLPAFRQSSDIQPQVIFERGPKSAKGFVQMSCRYHTNSSRVVA